MRVRTRTKWNQKDQPRDFDQVGSALAFNAWRIATAALLELENEGFQTDTQKQRLDIILEFLVFLLHSTDRLVYGRVSDQDRAGLITAFARHVDRIVRDNARDTRGAEEYAGGIIDLINEISNEYVEYPFTDGEPSFSYLRVFADRVAARMGPRDNKWILDHVMQVEGPESIRALRKALRSLVPETKNPATAG